MAYGMNAARRQAKRTGLRVAARIGSRILNSTPAGRAVGRVVGLAKGLFGSGSPPYSKSLRETRAAARAGDVATLRYKLANTKYSKVRKAARKALERLGNRMPGGAPALPSAVPAILRGAGPRSPRKAKRRPAGRRKARKRRASSRMPAGLRRYWAKRRRSR